MAQIRVIEHDGKEPEVVKGRTIANCVDLLVEKGVIDIERLAKRHGFDIRPARNM